MQRENKVFGNKNIVSVKRSSLCNDTPAVIPLVNNGVRHSGKPVSKMEVKNDMTHGTCFTHGKYKVCLKRWQIKAAQCQKEDKEITEHQTEAKRKQNKSENQRITNRRKTNMF